MLIGVTSDVLLAKKKHASMIESFKSRCESVRAFLKRLKHDDKFRVEIFELRDPVGRAADGPCCAG